MAFNERHKEKDQLLHESIPRKSKFRIQRKYAGSRENSSATFPVVTDRRRLRWLRSIDLEPEEPEEPPQGSRKEDEEERCERSSF